MSICIDDHVMHHMTLQRSGCKIYIQNYSSHYNSDHAKCNPTINATFTPVWFVNINEQQFEREQHNINRTKRPASNYLVNSHDTQ